MLLALFTSIFAPAQAADCADGRCAPNAAPTEAFVKWSAPDSGPAIDARAPAHLRVATFALG